MIAALTSTVCALMLASAEATVMRLDGTRIAAREIDATVNRAMQGAHIPAIGIVVLNGGTIVYLKTYGERDQGEHKPLTESSVMTAASLTKPAIAVMVLRLVEQGALDLDRPITRYLSKPLPEYPGYQDLTGDQRYARITLRMLLDHTSGFPNLRRFTDDGKLRIYFDPGTRFAYSGEGIRLAQLVAETVTGQSAESLMREYVFEPLGMSRTSMIWQSQFEDDYANAYDAKGKSLGPQRRRIADAAGSMQTTLHDYARFVQAMMNGKLLKPKTMEDMFSPQIRITSAHEFPTLATETTTANDDIRLSYGLAWGLFRTQHGAAFFKEGHDNGWQHYVVGFRSQGSALLIMTNSDHGEDVYGILLETLLRDTFTPYEWEGFKRPAGTQHPVQSK